MAGRATFTAHDAAHPGGYTLTTPPEKISESRFIRSSWRGHRFQGKRLAQNLSAKIILACSGEHECLYCGAYEDYPTKKAYNEDCATPCITSFRAKHFTHPIQIHSTTSTGLGAYNMGPGIIPKGTYIGEYVGDLLPLTPINDSRYAFEIPSLCRLDAEVAGNWTRFINSHCYPNLDCEPATIGKRHTMVFKPRKDIQVGDELTFYYEKGYFEDAGIKCGCGWKDGEHTPRGTGWLRETRTRRTTTTAAAATTTTTTRGKKKASTGRVTKKTSSKKKGPTKKTAATKKAPTKRKGKK